MPGERGALPFEEWGCGVPGIAAGKETDMQFVDLKGQYNKIKPEVDAAIAEVLAGTAFIKGPQVALFEENLSKFTGAKHVIGYETEAILSDFLKYSATVLAF